MFLPCQPHPSHLRACTRLRSVNSCRSTKACSTARFSSSLGGQAPALRKGVWEGGSGPSTGEATTLHPVLAWPQGRGAQNMLWGGSSVARALVWLTLCTEKCSQHGSAYCHLSANPQAAQMSRGGPHPPSHAVSPHPPHVPQNVPHNAGCPQSPHIAAVHRWSPHTEGS